MDTEKLPHNYEPSLGSQEKAHKKLTTHGSISLGCCELVAVLAVTCIDPSRVPLFKPAVPTY